MNETDKLARTQANLASAYATIAASHAATAMDLIDAGDLDGAADHNAAAAAEAKKATDAAKVAADLARNGGDLAKHYARQAAASARIAAHYL